MSAVGTTINRRLSSKGNSAEAIRFRVQMARNIRNAFGKRETTWSALADELGMTRERMSQINNAEVIANAIELTHLAKALGVSVDSLVEGCV